VALMGFEPTASPLLAGFWPMVRAPGTLLGSADNNFFSPCPKSTHGQLRQGVKEASQRLMFFLGSPLNAFFTWDYAGASLMLWRIRTTGFFYKDAP